ncbi:ABC transporter ATP-binding protein [Arcicella aquatica]|uniref:ABC transporter ATP-binding protein n=1 Tax=Arcicella aquatica TaxID=217141 RepID=A0ABU5QJ34_9BACT|nr:ABC transporter ATP-binding protein [Arcicella aquatica]MEA5256844.1 ABC transporter ATP-binding protein [Arcicella aquatica]
MTVIEAENISKKYIIDHIKSNAKADTLREVVTDKLKNIFSKKTEEQISHEEFWALKDVSFQINQGDRVGIIGSNGAGKSTMLKILSRITEPSQGKIKIKGRVASLLEVGTGFHPELSGRENIFLNGSILGMKRQEIKKHFDAIVDFAGVEKFLDTPVKRYSSGMYVRLGFAISAHLEPEILIVDEVLAVGDAEFQRKCLGKMKDASTSGRTILFVSHNLTAVQGLCNKSMYMQKGKLLEMGETNQVLATYLSHVQKTALESSWSIHSEAPGNDSIRLKKVKLTPDYHDNLKHIDVRTSFKIQIEFWSMVEGIDTNISLHLNSLTGECIFNIGTPSLNLRKGVIYAECEIPADFMNDGSYSISLMVVKDKSSVIYNFGEVLIFEIEDYREGSEWYGKWPGYIRPKINFPITQLELENVI